MKLNNIDLKYGLRLYNYITTVIKVTPEAIKETIYFSNKYGLFIIDLKFLIYILSSITIYTIIELL